MTRRGFVAGAAAGLAAAGLTVPAAAQTDGRLLRVVSTSGVPHGDVADYTDSPTWKPGMPTGANSAWRTYMHTVVGQVTAGHPDVVLHQGDMVEGRWGRDFDGAGVFGPVRTGWQKRQAIRRAADTIYPWVRRWWTGQRMLWSVGDHEIGDMGGSGVIPPDDFRYKAHWWWRDGWRRHFGASRYTRRYGPVGFITLDPFVKWRRGILARIPDGDFDWMAGRVDHWRANGVRWVVVQCEIPAVGPNREVSTSGLLLGNGDRLWDFFADVGVDVFVAGEFHADTTRSTAGRTPVQVVHGGRHTRASWLTIDVHQDRLELTLRESVGQAAGKGKIWATCPPKQRLNNRPVAGVPAVTGRMVVHADGSLSDRHGALTEGM